MSSFLEFELKCPKCGNIKEYVSTTVKRERNGSLVRLVAGATRQR